MVTRIWDYDPIGSDDLIDRVVINAELNAGSGSSVIQQPGSYGSAVVSLQYTVSCDSNFYGSTCDVYCRSRDDDTGHFTCDSFGNKVCLSAQQKIRTRSMHDRFVKFTSYYNQITMVAKKQHGARQSDHIRSLNILDYNEYTFMHGSICLICTSFLIDQEHARI